MAKPKSLPKQQQKPSGKESQMNPQPEYIRPGYKGSGKLKGKVALITGGDSGIGRATAVHFAREGADIVIVYHTQDDDAEETRQLVGAEGRKCLLIKGDVGSEKFCRDAVKKTVTKFGKLNVLVNNAAEQHPQKNITDITARQLEQTFKTNIFGYFFMTKAATTMLESGSTIINTTSVTAYRGSGHLLDYSSTKGAIVAFTRSLAEQLAEKGIRVNGVAPGPIWTPLIPSTFPPEKVAKFGQNVLLKRPGQPSEVAPCFVFLASEDSSYMVGQILHPNGGEIVNT